jgi:hypothetical protein
MLSNNSAASEGLPEFDRRASDSSLGRRLEAHRDCLMILARMQIGQRLQGKVDPRTWCRNLGLPEFALLLPLPSGLGEGQMGAGI